MRKPLKAAIVGCGMISGIYIKNLTGLFHAVEIEAFCDAFTEKAEEMQRLFGVGRVMSFEEILSAPEIDLVLNLTGPAQHYEIIKRSLLAGKHVFTEKVLCIDFEQSKELVALAKEKNLRLGVAPDTFLGAGLQTARFALDSGMIGRPTSCVACINRNQRLNSERFGYIRFAGGSFPHDVGVYYISALLHLLGPIEKISGFTSTIGERYKATFIRNGMYGKEWKLEGNNVSVSSFVTRQGVLGSFHFNGESIAEEQPHLVIYGTEGILYLGDPDHFDGYTRVLRHGAASVVELPFTHGYCGKPTFGPAVASDYGQHRGVGVTEMGWAIRTDRPHRASAEIGLHTVEVLHGIDQSAASGRVYEMTTSFERPAPLPSGHFVSAKEDAEISLVEG